MGCPSSSRRNNDPASSSLRFEGILSILNSSSLRSSAVITFCLDKFRLVVLELAPFDRSRCRCLPDTDRFELAVGRATFLISGIDPG